MAVNISNLNVSKNTIPPVLKYKIVFLGDQAVGKSSIINRFIYDIFNGDEHVPSPSRRDPLLASTSSRRTSTSRNAPLDCSCGTPPGRRRFRSLIPNYIRDSAVAILVYDTTSTHLFDADRCSFESIPQVGGGCEGTEGHRCSNLSTGEQNRFVKGGVDARGDGYGEKE